MTGILLLLSYHVDISTGCTNIAVSSAKIYRTGPRMLPVSTTAFIFIVLGIRLLYISSYFIKNLLNSQIKSRLIKIQATHVALWFYSKFSISLIFHLVLSNKKL